MIYGGPFVLLNIRWGGGSSAEGSFLKGLFGFYLLEAFDFLHTRLMGKFDDGQR